MGNGIGGGRVTGNTGSHGSLGPVVRFQLPGGPLVISGDGGSTSVRV